MPTLVKAHAFIMATAWMLIGGTGMTIASNYKTVIAKKVGGTQLWFLLHLGFILGAVILTAIGLTLILVHGWRPRASTHGIVGCIGIGLMVIQVIMGIARPDPSHPRRTVFYWAHFVVGTLVFTLSVDTILLSTLMEHLPATYRSKNMIVIIVWIVVLVLWMGAFMVIKILAKKRANQASPSSKEDKETVENNKEKVNDDTVANDEVSKDNNDEKSSEKPSEQSDILNRIMLPLLGVYIASLLLFFAIFVSYVAIY